jgi:hypothetical protein
MTRDEFLTLFRKHVRRAVEVWGAPTVAREMVANGRRPERACPFMGLHGVWKPDHPRAKHGFVRLYRIGRPGEEEHWAASMYFVHNKPTCRARQALNAAMVAICADELGPSWTRVVKGSS